MAQRVRQLAGAVGGVDGDQHDPGPRGGELHEHPLGAARAPDAHAIADAQPGRDEAAGERVDALVELAVAPAHGLMAADERVGVGEPACRAREVGPDRLAEQRDRTGPVGIGQHH
jgi:hypothetical protein